MTPFKLDYLNSSEVADWVADHIPWVRSRETFGEHFAVGVNKNSVRVAGVVFHGYKRSAGNVELSAAATTKRWISRDVVRELLHAAFVGLECQRASTITPRHNEAALRLNRHLGFQVEGIIRRGFGFDDAVIMGLLREEWEVGPFGPGDAQ